ncbi:MAG: AI-2E family transporter [Anaerolineae bacterium]|nr:AI-2E family transporter [Anaerolineae bacterium]
METNDNIVDVNPSKNTTHNSPQWDTWTRRVVTVILMLAGVYGFSLLVPVLPLLVTCLVVTFVLFAPARAITRRLRIPYALAVVLLYAILTAFVLFALLIFAPSLINWGNSLGNSVEAAYEDLKTALRKYESPDGIVKVLGAEIDLNPVIQPVRNLVLDAATKPTPLQPAPDNSSVNANGSAALQIDLQAIIDSTLNVAGTLGMTLTAAITGTVGFLVQLTLIIILTFFMLLEVPRTYYTFFELIPRAYHREYALLLDRVFYVWSRFIRRQLASGLLIAALTWAQLTLMGIPGAEILAACTGVLAPVPVIGTPLTLIPIALVSLLQGSGVALFADLSPGALVLLVVGINFAVQQVIWSRLASESMHETVDLPVPVLAIGLFVGIAIGGIVGALLVPPMLGMLRVILEYILPKLMKQDPYPGEREPVLLHEGLFAPVPFWGRRFVSKITVRFRGIHPPAPQ